MAFIALDDTAGDWSMSITALIVLHTAMQYNLWSASYMYTTL